VRQCQLSSYSEAPPEKLDAEVLAKRPPVPEAVE
jgi:hypothetical protein